MKINLKPDPAAEYFTVRDHQAAFSSHAFQLEDVRASILSDIKKLLNISPKFKVRLLRKEDVKSVSRQFTIVVKDEPASGIDLLKVDSDALQKEAVLDLSYSYPQVPLDTIGVHSVMIDPAKSMGIPGEFVLFISSKHIDMVPPEKTVREQDHESLFVLQRVLNDYLQKGKDVLLRESNYKAAVLYQLLEDSTHLASVAEKALHSKTIILAACDSSIPEKILAMGFEVGQIKKGQQQMIAIANYPTHSRELIEMFTDRVLAI